MAPSSAHVSAQPSAHRAIDMAGVFALDEIKTIFARQRLFKRVWQQWRRGAKIRKFETHRKLLGGKGRKKESVAGLEVNFG
ncbi:hypothetical protein HK104_003706 [Borealophlyctis nickersoniae]|nr:hypothetical protein HK104_003706 [Borealophlyctis nickersoniae]